MSVDSCTVDVEDWQGSDSCTIGDVGGGLLGSEIVVGGFLYGDLTLPGDADKEICGRITYWPPGLDLRTDEDGGLIASANDGSYVPLYQLYVDYVATGPETPLTLTFGVLSIAAAWTEGAEIFAATGIASAPDTVSGAIGWIEGAEVFAAAGTVSAPTAVTTTAAWTEGAESFVAAGIVVNPITAAAAWTEGGELFSISVQVVTQYARAPAGNGYTPQRDERQSRPAAIQRNQR